MSSAADVPALRVRAVNSTAIRPSGDFVLYWMIAARRTAWNFGLQRAASHARNLGKPLLILEALRCDHPYASDRLHQFVLDGMADNREACRRAGVAYYPYVEPEPRAGKGLLATLAERVCVVVTDDFPAYFLSRAVAAAGAELPIRVEAVDGNGLLPLRAADRAFARAFDFRRFLQRTLPQHLTLPAPDPLEALPRAVPAEVPPVIRDHWPTAPDDLLGGDPAALARLPIDHGIPPGPLRGGAQAAGERLRTFLHERLDTYAEDRNHPDREATSGLSPYLHFGHISTHEVFAAVMAREGWSEDLLGARAAGKRAGWWGVGPSAEAFLDQLITWRELGFNGCAHGGRWGGYESLPRWARETLERHAKDRRPHLYSLEGFRSAATHDPLWNAAQTQLLKEGRVHNYLRMLWGKKILEWCRGPEEALEIMLELNERYALDGRDPNSLSGIFWCLGRYDRAWGPERPVFGKVRYMSSANTARKVAVKRYLERYSP